MIKWGQLDTGLDNSESAVFIKLPNVYSCGLGNIGNDTGGLMC